MSGINGHTAYAIPAAKRAEHRRLPSVPTDSQIHFHTRRKIPRLEETRDSCHDDPIVTELAGNFTHGETPC